MELTDALKVLFMETAKSLKGRARRVFMARTVKELGSGGQRRAERELGWNRATIRKGTRELASGFAIADAGGDGGGGSRARPATGPGEVVRGDRWSGARSTGYRPLERQVTRSGQPTG